MSKRVTIMLDDDLDKKLRTIQSRTIAYTTQSLSFSKVVNDQLRAGLKKA